MRYGAFDPPWPYLPKVVSKRIPPQDWAEKRVFVEEKIIMYGYAANVLTLKNVIFQFCLRMKLQCLLVGKNRFSAQKSIWLIFSANTFAA
jgi:hypothetical protein